MTTSGLAVNRSKRLPTANPGPHCRRIPGLHQRAGRRGHRRQSPHNLNSTGDVYFLDKLEDFHDKHGTATIGATAEKGSVVATVQNNKGVILRLKAKATGATLNLGVGGI